GVPARHRLGYGHGLGGIAHQEAVLRRLLPRLGLKLLTALLARAVHGISCSWAQWGQRTTFRGGADLLGISHSWPEAVCHFCCSSAARSICGPGSGAASSCGGPMPASSASSASKCCKGSLSVLTSRKSASSLAESASANAPIGSSVAKILASVASSQEPIRTGIFS